MIALVLQRVPLYLASFIIRPPEFPTQPPMLGRALLMALGREPWRLNDSGCPVKGSFN